MNLKSILQPSQTYRDQRFAYLIEPAALVTNDNELYASVFRHGRAVLREFDGASLKLGEIKELTPTEFERTWRGD